MNNNELKQRIARLQEVRKQHRVELEKYSERVAQIQATLYAIKTGRDVFFNVTFYETHGLIRPYGRTIDNKTRYVLTAKGEQILNVNI